jgi:hypothetical protein
MHIPQLDVLLQGDTTWYLCFLGKREVYLNTDKCRSDMYIGYSRQGRLRFSQPYLSSPSKRQFNQQTLLGTTKVDHSQQQQSPTIIVCDFIHNF